MAFFLVAFFLVAFFLVAFFAPFDTDFLDPSPFFVRILPIWTIRSKWPRSTGCTDNRIPRLRTYIPSKEGSVLTSSKGTGSAKRSTNPRSTMYQTGSFFVDRGS